MASRPRSDREVWKPIIVSSNLISLGVATVDDLKRPDWLSVGTATSYEREIVDMLHNRGVSRIRTQIVLRNDAAILFQLLAKGRHIAALPRLPALALCRQVPLVELALDGAVTVSRDLYLRATQEFVRTPGYGPVEKVVREVFESLLSVGPFGGVDAGGPTPDDDRFAFRLNADFQHLLSV